MASPTLGPTVVLFGSVAVLLGTSLVARGSEVVLEWEEAGLLPVGSGMAAQRRKQLGLLKSLPGPEHCQHLAILSRIGNTYRVAFIFRLSGARRHLVVVCTKKCAKILLRVDLLNYLPKTHRVRPVRATVLEWADAQTVAQQQLLVEGGCVILSAKNRA